MTIELTPEQQQLVNDIHEGQYEEPQLVAFIKEVLLTEDQRAILWRNNLDIYDLLNGRYTISEDALVKGMFKDWNDKMGEHMFGF